MYVRLHSAHTFPTWHGIHLCTPAWNTTHNLTHPQEQCEAQAGRWRNTPVRLQHEVDLTNDPTEESTVQRLRKCVPPVIRLRHVLQRHDALTCNDVKHIIHVMTCQIRHTRHARQQTMNIQKNAIQIVLHLNAVLWFPFIKRDSLNKQLNACIANYNVLTQFISWNFYVQILFF